MQGECTAALTHVKGLLHARPFAMGQGSSALRLHRGSLAPPPGSHGDRLARALESAAKS